MHPLAKNVGEKAYELKGFANIFIMNSHYDDEGNSIARVEGEGFAKIDGDLEIRYGLSQDFEILSGLRMRQNISNSTTADVVNTGLESLFGGVRFNLVPEHNRLFNYTLEFLYRYKAYTSQVYSPGTAPTDELVLGDQGSELTFGLHFSYDNTINNYLYAFMGYRAPGNELSPEMIYTLETFYPYTAWGFGLGVNGVFSLGGDPYTGDPNNKPDQATGSSYLYNSINRSYISPYFRLEKAFTKWKMTFQLAQTAAGISTDEGFTYSFGLTYKSEGVSQEKKKISKFKEYTVEASVLKSSPRASFIKIDKGIAQDVEKGMRFDIFKSDYFGGNILIATGVAFEVGADWTIVKILTRYRDMRILPGFVARGF